MSRLTTIAVLLFVLFFSTECFADVGRENEVDTKTVRTLRLVLRRQESRFHREHRSAYRNAGPNYSGRWAGRFVLVKADCDVPITSFLFRHIVGQNGAAVAINTSHDGLFLGSSRDRGRRIEAYKRITSNSGVPLVLGVGYKNLSRDGRVSSSAYVITSGACTAGFGANSIRQ